MHEVYRVRRPFFWRGWHYGPAHVKANIDQRTGKYEPCDCPHYGGDIWVVEAGHSRKEAMITQRLVVGDASLPSVEELLKEERFWRLLSEPDELVGAGVRRREKPATPR